MKADVRGHGCATGISGSSTISQETSRCLACLRPQTCNPSLVYARAAYDKHLSGLQCQMSPDVGDSTIPSSSAGSFADSDFSVLILSFSIAFVAPASSFCSFRAVAPDEFLAVRVEDGRRSWSASMSSGSSVMSGSVLWSCCGRLSGEGLGSSVSVMDVPSELSVGWDPYESIEPDVYDIFVEFPRDGPDVGDIGRGEVVFPGVMV